MNTVSLNSLWSYLQSLGLTTSNKKWLADHLYEAVKEDDNREAASMAQLDTLQKARALTKKQLLKLEKQEYISLEDLRLLLYRTVDDIYSQS